MQKLFDINRPLTAYVVFSTFFAFLGGFFIVTGYGPVHDAMEWHGVFHYFYSSLEQGSVPYWNPYSQTGTPFFTYFQAFGLLDPTNLLCVPMKWFTGSTTFSTYLIHYLFYYFLFIIGTYEVIAFLGKNKPVALLFSGVLLLGCFPMFMRQNGALNSFYLIPSITYFALRTLNEFDISKRYLFLFIFVSMSAISINIHIPSFLIYYLIVLWFGLLIVNRTLLNSYIKDFLKIKTIFWILMAGTAFFFVLPMLAQYHYLRYDAEMFPSMRFLQKNGNNLVKFFASDVSIDVMSASVTDNLKVSSNLYNLIGLVFEPTQHILFPGASSEIFMYIGILPLASICLVYRARNKYAWLFLVIGLITFCLMQNFNFTIIAKSTFIQSMFMMVFPFLDKLDVLQNCGSLFLFCMVVVSSFGYLECQKKQGSRFLYVVIIISIIKLLYAVGIVWMLRDQSSKLRELMKYGDYVITYILHSGISVKKMFVLGTLTYLVILGFRFVYGITKKVRGKPDFRLVNGVALGILFVDLVFFGFYHAVHSGGRRVIDDRYFQTLKEEAILETKKEKMFSLYRKPFSYPERTFNTFFGHEILNRDKTALPYALAGKLIINPKVSWDHFFMTKYYYDYIMNVDLIHQVVLSNINTPILNFYPLKDCGMLSSKYDVVNILNRTALRDLSSKIYIEDELIGQRGRNTNITFFDKEIFVRFDASARTAFFKNLSQPKQVLNKNIQMNIINFNANQLLLDIDLSFDGYLYYGDGYSKYWKAYVDGKKTTIYKTNVNFKSIFVPSGKHSVLFKYDPYFIRYSLYLYFCGIIIFVAVLSLGMFKKGKFLRLSK